MKRVEDLDIKGKVILLRTDFDVPVEDGVVTDPTRIEKEMENLEFLSMAKQVIIISHLGRPLKALKKGRDFDEIKKEYTLKPVADYLAEKFKDFVFIDDCLKEVPSNKFVLLENVRFFSEEKQNDIEFAQKLSHNADIYVNDAFANSHREHTSMVAIAKYFKSIDKPVAAGKRLQFEVEHLNKLISNPVKPFVAVLGGAKVSDKIKAIYGLMDYVDSLIIGGGMAYTFLKYKGHKIGKSLFEETVADKPYKEAMDDIYSKASEKNVSIILPSDHIIADKVEEDGKFDYNASVDIPDDLIGVDIGKKTILEFTKVLNNAKTIFWNGPLGIFEIIGSSFGSREIANVIISNKGFTVVGGGDTVAAMDKFKIDESSYSFVSTGGGASLDYIRLKGKLPGILVLE